MIVNENEPLEEGLIYRFNYNIKPAVFSFKPSDSWREKLANELKNNIIAKGFNDVSAYVYEKEIHVIGRYMPKRLGLASPAEFEPQQINFSPILVGAIVIAISALVVAFAFSITGKSVEKFTNPPVNYILLGSIVLIVILVFVFFNKRR